MIKYNTKLGSEDLNLKAREQRDLIKGQLTGMHCNKCRVDTVISFEASNNFQVYPVFNACCHEFELRIRKRLWSNS